MRSRGILAVWLGALLVGFVLRALPLTAARPYIAYVDEGNVLHPAFDLVRDGGWDPRTYLYPQFPLMAFTAAARALDPVYRLARGRSLRARIPPRHELYDELEPFPLLLLARCLSLAVGLGIIVWTGLLAARMAGPRAGAAAALLAALTPALVLRGAIVSVDSYAVFFVLACAYLTDLTRTSGRPGAVSLAAGAAAGAAFASKYPAVLVLVAFVATTLLQPLRLSEKARRLALAASGLAIGAAAAMPAVVVHPLDVYQAIRQQASIYGQIHSVSLWRQAFLRAEWDIPYERAELGFLFVALALGGLVLGLRDRRTSPSLWGWCAAAGTWLLLYGRQTFQPFRNLLPLVPLGCIAIAILYVRARQQTRNPWWVDAVAVVWLLSAFAVPLFAYAKTRHELQDSRKLAMDWLVAHTQSGDRTLVIRELGFLHQELERLPAEPIVTRWEEAPTRIRSALPRFVVAGVIRPVSGPPIDVAASPPVRGDYEMRFRSGERATLPYDGWWRGNDQIVTVLERIRP